MFDPELERFKQVDLRAYAARQGYQLDKKASWRGNAVMRHANGDKIVIKRDDDGHYLYFSVHRDNDSGTIIDFVQHRQNLSLGAVRKELRPWIGMPSSAIPDWPPLPHTQKDRLRVETEFAGMQNAPRHPYLENERGLPFELLESDRFIGRIRMDVRGNAVFPHYDREGLCGYEIKNLGFTGFSPGGSKGLWSSHDRPDDNQLVFCESAIDALSHAVLFRDDRTRYASIGGKTNPIQPELIRSAVTSMPPKSRIVSAMDADAEGGKLALIVRDAVLLSGRDDLAFIFQEPFGFKDWNDQLRGKPSSSFPAARLKEPSVA